MEARARRPGADDLSGRRVAPFFTEGAEGFSIDYPDDVELAERLLARGEAELPPIREAVR